MATRGAKEREGLATTTGTESEALASLASLRPDPRNARRHTPRNDGLNVDALHEVGAARSIVIDEDDTILAGNARVRIVTATWRCGAGRA
jgi:hypothetical protein